MSNADDYYRVTYARLAEIRRGRDKMDRSPRVTKKQPPESPKTCSTDDESCEACQ